MTIPDCTLVTACFELTKYNPHSRSMEDSIQNMVALLEVPCYLVIFIDNNAFPLVHQKRNEEFKLGHLTHYVVMNVEELNSFRFQQTVHSNRREYHPTKDERTCPESHLVCSSKFEMVLNAIERDPFHTNKYGWIDSNVGKNFSKISTNYTNNMLLRILNNCNPDKFHLQILDVCDKTLATDERLCEYYSQYRFIVCGCLFITGKILGMLILTDLNRVFEEHTLKGYGHGEEMYYLPILDLYYDNIQRSYGNYNQILNNFLGMNVGQSYIYKISSSYRNHKYHIESVDCASYAIKSYENYEIPIDQFYFFFLFNHYVSSYYIDIEKSKQTVKKIKELVKEHPVSRNIYLEQKDFFDAQFIFVDEKIEI
jgi:hypothetical protein